MSFRFFLSFTALLACFLIVLFFTHLLIILNQPVDEQPFLKYNAIRGIAVNYKNELYTLNFQQQMSVIQSLNQCERMTAMPSIEKSSLMIDQLLIYLFNETSPLIIYPLGFLKDRFVFFIPKQDSDQFWIEKSESKLYQIICDSVGD